MADGPSAIPTPAGILNSLQMLQACRTQDSGSRHSCSAAAFCFCTGSRRLGRADGPRETCSFLELLSSGSAPIKLGFYGPPCVYAHGCVYAITGICNTFRRRSGPTFSNAISRSLDPPGLWFVLKLVYFGFENTVLLFSTNWLHELACFPQTLLLATPVAPGFSTQPSDISWGPTFPSQTFSLSITTHLMLFIQLATKHYYLKQN